MNRRPLCVLSCAAALASLAACGTTKTVTVTDTVTATQMVAGPVVTVTETVSPPPPPQGHAVATFTGSGAENTPQFTVSDTWKLTYSFDCSAAGGTGNFIVNEDGGNDGAGGVAVNDLAASKSASTYAYGDAGTHYLDINSECSWTVTVIDES